MAKIMIVDDDPDFVEIMCMILEFNNYETTNASDSQSALVNIRRDKPDLIILDLMMASVLDGMQLSQNLKADPALQDIPIIMVSSIEDSPHAEQQPTLESLPADAWISKPGQPDELLEKVQKCLG